MRELLILGTNSHALEVADIVDRINRAQETWNLLGFVSASDHMVGTRLRGLPVIGASQAWDEFPAAQVIAEPEWPQKPRIPRHRLTSLIDPSSFVSTTAQIGLGCIVFPHCFVGSDVRIGDFLFCLAGSVINHQDIIEQNVTIAASATIAGNVHIEADCYVGQSCTIREMTRIGRGSLIGMGSVVLADVAPNSVMVGNPARKLGARRHELADIRPLQSVKWSARNMVKALRRTARSAVSSVFCRHRPASEA